MCAEERRLCWRRKVSTRERLRYDMSTHDELCEVGSRHVCRVRGGGDAVDEDTRLMSRGMSGHVDEWLIRQSDTLTRNRNTSARLRWIP